MSMTFKFKKNDKVVISTSNMFNTIFGGFASALTTEPSKITDCRVHNGVIQYKVKGFTGWWNESNLQEA